MTVEKRLIIDTNLWIHFLISKSGLSELEKLLVNRQVKLIFSEELLGEFWEVALRPKFKKFFTAKNLELLIKSLSGYSEIIEVTSNIQICRDPKDDFLIHLAIDSKADYLITGDDDLLVLGSVKETRIITWADFIRLESPS